MEKIWLKSYPPGVPAEIDPSQYSSVADLFEDFMERHAKIYLRPNSIRCYEVMGRKIIVPKIGNIKVADLRRRDIEELHQSLKDTPYHANRTRALLSKMMSVAKRWEWRNDNPCEGIPKFPEEKRDRWLSTEEIERLLSFSGPRSGATKIAGFQP